MNTINKIPAGKKREFRKLVRRIKSRHNGTLLQISKVKSII